MGAVAKGQQQIETSLSAAVKRKKLTRWVGEGSEGVWRGERMCRRKRECRGRGSGGI